MSAARAPDGSRWPSTLSARQMAGADPVMSDGPTSAGSAASPLDRVPISLVGAVEIYPTGVDVPTEFKVPGSECGVVLVWTTRR